MREGLDNVCCQFQSGTEFSMGDELDQTVAFSAEELDAMGVVTEEEGDESGAPEKVAWPFVDDEARLASAEPSVNDE
ncbi:MAG TPA: hypothetical protein VD766_05200 [Solirubrobacterales bacterium]|nr:hypothetical protein [Solirubrobacterales bacterium]